MTEVLAPASTTVISPREPFIAKTCVLVPPAPPEPPPEDDIFVPKPPGVVIDDLPDLEPETQIIDTSPSRIIGCANALPSSLEQQVLNAFFPARIEEDGVVNRENNDIWVYREGVWQNVGPTPGPTVVVVTVVPPWNEIIKVDARTRTLLGVTLRNYTLRLLTSLSLTTKTKVVAMPLRRIMPPASVFSLLTSGPIVRGGAARVVETVNSITGTAAPVLGSTQVDPSFAISSGWTLVFSGSNDESSTQTGSFGFSFNLNGISYADCFVNSNSYITFGEQQNVYESLGQASPSLPKIHVGSGDYSYQRVYVKSEPAVYRIRWEGNTSYSAPAGSSNRFFEINFHRQLEDGTQYIEVRSGDVNGFNPGPFMIATATTALAQLPNGSFASNQSWVFTGNATGTEWTLTAGRYVDYQVSLDIKIPSAVIQVDASAPEIEISLDVRPDASSLNVQSFTPSLSTGSSISPETTNHAIVAPSPSRIGYRAYIEVPTEQIGISPGVFSIASGASVLTAQNIIHTAASAPIISSGASISAPMSAIEINGNITAAIGLVPFIDVHATNLAVEGTAPAVSSGVSVAAPAAGVAIVALAPTVTGGASVAVPAASITLQGIAPAITANPAPTDPSFSSVSLLLHMDGNDGEAVFTDDSNNQLTVVATGATTSTTQVKFGQAAMACGSTSRLDIASTNLLPLQGDFTIELWVWKSSSQTAQYVRFLELGSYQNGILLGLDGVYINSNGPRISTIPLVNDTWCHYALTRSGTTVRSFVNGIQHGSDVTISGSLPSTVTAALRIGQASHTTGQYLNGYIDDLRITNGAARYVENFTPPTAPFPDFGPPTPANVEIPVSTLQLVAAEANISIGVQVATPLTVINVSKMLPSVTIATAFDPDFASVSALLHFDGSITDDSSNNFTVSALGDAQITATDPKFGSGALLLDGTGDYLTLPADAAFQLGTGDFTVEFWAYLNSGNNNNGIFTFGGTSSGLALALYQGQWFLNQFGSNGVQLGSFTTGVWQHVAVARSGTSLRLFVNGTQVGATQSSSVNFTDNQLKIGYYYSSAFGVIGKLDEFRVTKGVARYTANFTAPTAPFPDSGPPPTVVEVPVTSLVVNATTPTFENTTTDPNFANVSLLLHMDGSNGSTTFVDSSTNALTVTAYGNAQISTAQSKFGSGSLLLDGSFDYLVTESTPDLALGVGDFTVEFFVYRTSTRNDQGIFTFGGIPSGLFAAMDNSVIGIGVNGGDPVQISGGPINLNTWHHVAITRSNGSLRAFIDGVQIGSTVSNSTNLTDSQLKIGYSYTTTYSMVGSLDEFRVTKGVARYTANFTPPAAPFPDSGPWTPARLSTALWLDADTGSSIALTSGAVSQWSDRSGNSRHATQGTSGQRPTVNATGIDNKPAISFDGSDDWLALPTGFLNGTTSFTIAMVLAAPLQQNDAIFGPSSNFSTGLELVCTNTASQPTLLRVNNSNRIISGLWSTNSTPTLTTITASATATAGWLNGSAVSAASSAGISALNFNGIYALGRYGGSFNAQMLVGEFIILESSVSTDARQKLEGYLAHKWGIAGSLPGDHPYKSAAP